MSFTGEIPNNEASQELAQSAADTTVDNDTFMRAVDEQISISKLITDASTSIWSMNRDIVAGAAQVGSSSIGDSTQTWIRAHQ